MKINNQQLIQTKQASLLLARTSAKQRNLFLTLLQKELLKNMAKILSANQKDLLNYDPSDSLYDRLLLDEKRIRGIVDAVEKIRKLPDPLDSVREQKTLVNKLKLTKVSVPLGVICVIYESRPNVTIDVAALGMKSGNALVLKGGKESRWSNVALTQCIHTALDKAKLPREVVLLLPAEREVLHHVLQQDRLIDVVIPRGSQQLIDYVRKSSSIPVIETGRGVVHTYVDASADLKMAVDIIVNEKTQRPSVCNALDFLLVHKKIAAPLLKMLIQDKRFQGVEMHADPRAYKIVETQNFASLQGQGKNKIQKMTQQDLGMEYLSLILGVQIVDSMEEALEHIHKYSSRHSESVVTNDEKKARQFLRAVDAAAVYWNASTRFTDGEMFGMGGEIGISTQKLHARGPMGLPELTSYKWVIEGKGQILP